MLELSTDNLLPYLRERGWLPSGLASVEVLSGGVSNVVFRINTGAGDLVVKQSRRQLRTRAAWFSDLERIFRELEVMQVLAPLLPDVVPRVLHVDRDNYTFAMSAAPASARPWKALLLEGELVPALARQVGQVLGRMHQTSAEHPELFRPFVDSTVFGQLRIDPFYRRIQECHPDLAGRVQDLIDQMLTRREGLCHGDYTPKNLLIHPTGFLLVDYETAHVGDPTMDLGLLQCHLILKMVRRAEQPHPLLELLTEVRRGYAEEVSFRPVLELEARGLAHCGVCLLARVDGTSPVDYLDASQQQVARQFGRLLLETTTLSWPEAVTLFDKQLSGGW